MAVGCGWQAFVAYVNVGCYYVVGIPLGVLLGFYFNLGAKVYTTYQIIIIFIFIFIPMIPSIANSIQIYKVNESRRCIEDYT